MTHLLADLGCVDSDLNVWLYCSCSAAQARQWNIPNPSQPNPVREEMGHPVCKVVEHPKSMSTKPQSSNGTPCSVLPLHKEYFEILVLGVMVNFVFDN